MHPVEISALRAKLDNFKLARLPLAAKEVLVGTPSEVARNTIVDAKGVEIGGSIGWTADPIDLDPDFAELAAAAINALPWLLDEVELLKSARDDLSACLDEHRTLLGAAHPSGELPFGMDSREVIRTLVEHSKKFREQLSTIGELRRRINALEAAIKDFE